MWRKVVFRDTAILLKGQVKFVQHAKNAFLDAEFRGGGSAESVLNVSREMLESLYADTLALKESLATADERLGEAQEPQSTESEGYMRRCIARMRQHYQNWLSKSSQERKEANRAVKQESAGLGTWFKKKMNRVNVSYGEFSDRHHEALRKMKARANRTEKTENAENKDPNTKTDGGPSQ